MLGRSPIPHNNIGLALSRMGDIQGAITSFQRGLFSTQEGAYGRGMIHGNLGHVYQSISRHDLAISSLQNAISEEPTLEAYCMLGSALIDTGDFAGAQRAVQRGMEEMGAHGSVEARRVLARALIQQGGSDDALDVMAQVRL